MCGGPLSASETPWAAAAGLFHRVGNAVGESHRSACVRFHHHPQRATLAIERRQELRANVGRRQQAVRQSLQRGLLRSIRGSGHACLESHNPARPVRGPSWVHAAHNAMSRSSSALGTKDIGSSSSTWRNSVNRSGSRVVAQTSWSRRRACGSRLIALSGCWRDATAGRPGSGCLDPPPPSFVPIVG